MIKYLQADHGARSARRRRIAFSSCRAWATSPAFSAQLRVLAIDLSKIASDLRLMVMGPRTGIDEITLPAVQPGSSIMPGKINPSIPEMVNQVCFQVIGLRHDGRHRVASTDSSSST